VSKREAHDATFSLLDEMDLSQHYLDRSEFTDDEFLIKQLMTDVFFNAAKVGQS
jgi:hypothetical protein